MIVIDFETKSDIDISGGVRCYATHPTTDILMMAWADTSVDDTVHQWFPDDALPEWVYNYDPVYAFNTNFEAEIWDYVMVPRYHAPDIPLARWHDVQSLCARYSLPRNLKMACTVLGVPSSMGKMSEGTTLIKWFCAPPYSGTIPSPAWSTFCEYNRQDVVATIEVLRRLPSMTLSASERAIFELNWEINRNGLPVAVDEAARIYEAVQAYLAEHNQLLPELTGGAVTRITQVKRIVTWLGTIGIHVDDLRADTVSYLLGILTHPDAIQVLELRASTGLSSIGKFKRIVDMATNGRIHYNSNYYGAHTGRITGSGFQLLNLPRATVDDPEAEIADFISGDIMERNPVLSARALVRSMIKAPAGHRLICADYSSIEFILLVWLAEENRAVCDFANGIDQYKRLAASMYNVDYDSVTKSQRAMGKIGILGCGYGLGVQGCINYAAQFGMTLSEEEARAVVEGYRRQFPGVRALWYELAEAAASSVQCAGESFTAARTTFRVVKAKNRAYLRVQLPSGRAMFYHDPHMDEGKYGPLVFVRGVHQTTKQWLDREMTPGKWAENVIQAIGRDLLYHGKFALKSAGYKIIGSIYDEVIAEMPNGTGSLEEFTRLMSTVPEWGAGLPIRAEGWEGTRYRKQ